MRQIIFTRLFNTSLVILAGLLAMPVTGAAQEVSGQAKAVQATVLGITSVLADTGTLSGEDDARESSQSTGGVSSLGNAKTLHAATVSSVYGWDSADFVSSEASLADLGLGISGNTISADFLMAEALAPVGGSNTGSTSIAGLLINGMPVAVTGAVNQTIPLLGGKVIINEQQNTPSGDIVVNALHIIVDGVADVVLASATAGANSGSSSTGSSGGGLLGLGL